MKKILLLFFILQTSICFSQANTNISNFTFWDTEPYIAINPSNSNNLIAAWMRASAPSTLSASISYSSDGGATWSTPSNIPHLHANFTSADVSIAFNAAGDAFLSYIDAAISNDSGYVMVAKSTNGGASWFPGVKVMNGLATPDFPIDRPWIAIDKSGGAYNGRLYVTSKSVDFGAMPHHIWMKYSADNGATWSAQTLVDDSIPSNLITNAMGVPTVGADGSLYIGYASYDPPSNPFPRMICLKSTDGGVNFIPYVIGYPVSSSGITDTLYQGSHVLSANPLIAGNIIFTFTDQRNGDPDILSAHSNDGGLTWTTVPVRINDDVISNGVGQDMCWAGFSSTGKYAVAWRDRRNTGGSSTSSFEVFTSVSLDGGVSFKPNYNLSTAPSPFINIQKGNDFLGVCLDDTELYVDWCDLRTGNTEIFVNKVSMTTLSSVSEFAMENLQLKIYPNPTADNAQLEFDLMEMDFLEISLTTIEGQLLKTFVSEKFNKGKNQVEIKTDNLSAGSYLIVVKFPNKKIQSSAFLTIVK